MERKNFNFRQLFFSVGNTEQEVQEISNFLDLLCEEAYYKVLPQNVVDFIKRNISGLLKEQMLNIVRRYQDYDILFLPDNDEQPDKKCTHLIFVDQKVCLIKQTANIPMLDYLHLFLNGVAAEAIFEYSRIPESWQKYVYDSLIEFFRMESSETAKI